MVLRAELDLGRFLKERLSMDTERCECQACVATRALERTQRTVNELRDEIEGLKATLRSWQAALEGAMAVDATSTFKVAEAIVRAGKIETPVLRGKK